MPRSFASRVLTMENLLANLPDSLPNELVTVLAESPHVRIERIVSTGQTSPEGTWYDQEESEWVVLLQGEARLRVEGEESARHLAPGDHLLIPPRLRHRVEWTHPSMPTVWLAVFYPALP